MYKLRELEKKDLQTINKWRNDQELVSYLGGPFRYINYLVDEKWFDIYMDNRSSQIRCSIVNERNEVLGLVSLLDIDYIKQSAIFHIMIGDKENQGKGIGFFATKEMLNHAFNNINLHRVELDVYTDNDRAIHLYEKVGFVKEGTKRQCNFKQGKFVDMHIYSILKEEFNLKNK